MRIFLTTSVPGEESTTAVISSSPSASRSGDGGAAFVVCKFITQNSHFGWRPFLTKADLVRIIPTISPQTIAHPTHTGDLRMSGMSTSVTDHERGSVVLSSVMAITESERSTFARFVVLACVAITNVGPPNIQQSVVAH